MSDSSHHEDEALSWWDERLLRIKENDPNVKSIDNFQFNEDDDIQNTTGEKWEELGSDISNNTHLTELNLHSGALHNDKISFLFRGLTRSSSIKTLNLNGNGFSVGGVRSMVPFLQNANSLTSLYLRKNNIQSEGFNVLLRALRNSSIESLICNDCGIDSIEIDSENIPVHLKALYLNCNSIDADGCRGLTKLLQGRDATLETLYLQNNKIDDEGVEILVETLQRNTSLRELYLVGNEGISKRGKTSLLKLVNDISGIEATLQSNHTLRHLNVVEQRITERIQMLINTATRINKSFEGDPETAGREKVIQTQLNSKTRADLTALQGVNHSLYSEIDPLHLPEVLALVGRRLGQKELYTALRSAIAGVISIVNREQCIEVQMAYHASKLEHHASRLEQLGAELAAIKAARGGKAVDGETLISKRRRKWWWDLWGRTS